jgi:hypothetical protein
MDMEFAPHDNGDTLEPREGTKPEVAQAPPLMYNFDYQCHLSGHIMDKWYPKSGGTAGWKLHRVCVIPTCAHTEEKVAKS